MTNLKYYIENPDNPQTITDENYRDLVKSLREDPETLAANNIAFATDYKSPISGVDYSGQRVVIAGNKRLRALKEIYGEAADVPDEWFFDLTPLGEEKRRRWLVKSNVQSGEWVADTLSKLYTEDELRGLLPTEDLDDLLASLSSHSPADLHDTGAASAQEFDLSGSSKDAHDDGPVFERSEGNGVADDGDNPEYQAFVDKFKSKKTTDDCYTPPNIYEAVLKWSAAKYGFDPAKAVRPFFPGGDFERFDYPDGCVVVDNPPFSILAKILRLYNERKIDYFLFAPSLTLFSAAKSRQTNYIVVNLTLTYENGANIATSFVTSLGDNLIECVPDLYDELDRINDENRKEGKAKLPKYVYPDAVITSARLGYFTNHHTPFKVKREDAVFIRALDAQAGLGESIFGGGFLLSERAAAERAAAHRWELSPREIEMQRRIGKSAEAPST